MDVDSTENRLEELSSFLKEEGSSFAAESDLSFVANKEENVEGYSYADIAINKEHVDMNDQGQHSDLRYNEICGSPSENFQSVLQTSFDHDLLSNGPRVAVDHHPKEEADVEVAVDLSKSSAPVESEIFHREMGSEVVSNLQEFPLRNQEEEMEGRPTSQSRDKIGDGNPLETSNYELVKPDFSYEELDHEVYDMQSEKLQHENETKRENPDKNIKFEILHPLELASPRTDRKMSLSPLTSPSNKVMFASEEKSSVSKEVLPEDHKLRSNRQNASSPQDSPRGTQHKNGGSPRNHDSVEKQRRRYSSVSRSPIRQRDSSSRHQRDHYHRSRSRSPYRRDHYRRSTRRRCSPRRRSPPSGYHAYRRSPKRRHWSPPHNRSTGIGKPGRNLFVAGFSFLTTERDLERKFSRFGRVRDVRIVRDKRSGDSRGFGFLSLERDEEADAAIRALDKTEWHGRIVLVEKSKSH